MFTNEFISALVVRACVCSEKKERERDRGRRLPIYEDLYSSMRKEEKAQSINYGVSERLCVCVFHALGLVCKIWSVI